MSNNHTHNTIKDAIVSISKANKSHADLRFAIKTSSNSENIHKKARADAERICTKARADAERICKKAQEEADRICAETPGPITESDIQITYEDINKALSDAKKVYLNLIQAFMHHIDTKKTDAILNEEINNFITGIYDCITRMRIAVSKKNITETDINELFRFIMNSSRIMRIITNS